VIPDVEAQMVRVLVSVGASHAEASRATEVLRQGGSLAEAADAMLLPGLRPVPAAAALASDVLMDQLRRAVEESRV
jgi:hypothetical protein